MIRAAEHGSRSTSSDLARPVASRRFTRSRPSGRGTVLLGYETSRHPRSRQGDRMGSKKKSTTRRSSATPKETTELEPATLAPDDELFQRLEAEGVKWAKIGGFDIDGVLRGKYVSLAKLRSALTSGFGFCDVIFGWDVADALYSDAKVTGWHTGYPDAHAVLDPSTLRRIPWEPDV